MPPDPSFSPALCVLRGALLAMLLFTAGCSGQAASQDASDAVSTPAPRHSPVTGSAAPSGEPDRSGEPAADLAGHVLQYEAAVAGQVGDAAQACWQADVARFNARLAGCADDTCANAARLQRLAELDAMQPGMTRLSRPLPEAAMLIAVLGPEVDVDSPPAGTAPDLGPDVVEGALEQADAHAEHMGLAVSDAAGHAHVIVFDMDLGNQPGHDVLLAAIRTGASPRIRVEGTLVVNPDSGLPNFDISRCRQVYRLR